MVLGARATLEVWCMLLSTQTSHSAEVVADLLRRKGDKTMWTRLSAAFGAVILMANVAHAANSSAKWIDVGQTKDGKIKVTETATGYILADTASKASLELAKADVRIVKGAINIREGAIASRATNKEGEVVEKSSSKTPDRRTFCAGFAQTCCANSRVIHACVGATGCDFGDDSACTGLSEVPTPSSNSLKITIAVDGKDCATKGGTLITNKDGSKTCTMPANCEVIASATTATNLCSVAEVTAQSGPSQCCCRGCQNSTLPRCSFCSGQ